MIKLIHNPGLRRLVFASVFALAANTAFALNLEQAKAGGMVKETANGYLVVVKQTDEVKALVKKINDGRKAEYKKIAKKRGTSLEAVEQLAGAKLSK